MRSGGRFERIEPENPDEGEDSEISPFPGTPPAPQFVRPKSYSAR